jgi:hypothetical protein
LRGGRPPPRWIRNGSKYAHSSSVISPRIKAALRKEQQQITVKHVTVNADQAVVTDQVLSGGRREDVTAALLPATTDRAMEIIEPMRKELVGIQRGGSERK